jgi:hypothetical protein
MEEVDDEVAYLRNMAPLNPSHVLELRDGSDDDNDEDNCPPLVMADEDDEVDNEDDKPSDEPEKSAEAELGQLLPYHTHGVLINIQSDSWNSPVYVFFKQTPSITYINDCHVHIFECAVTRCKGKGNGRMVCRYLDTGNAKSTSNLRKHAKIC